MVEYDVGNGSWQHIFVQVGAENRGGDIEVAAYLLLCLQVSNLTNYIYHPA